MAKKIADELGVELEINDMDFGALIEALKNGIIDIILADIHPTADREKEVDFTLMYYVAYAYAIVTLKEKAGEIISIESLYGKKVGVQTGTIQEKWALENLANKSEIISYDRVYPEMVLALERGDIDVIIVGDLMAEVITKKIPKLIIVMKFGPQGGAAVAVPQEAEELKYIINKLIEKMVETGEMDKIFEEELSKYLEQG